MSCEACGGDGQIEYGAYRGDNSTETRECRLCGGVVTTTLSNAETVGSHLDRLAQKAGHADFNAMMDAKPEHRSALSMLEVSADDVSSAFNRLGQAAARTGVKVEQMVHKSSRSGSRVVDRVITFNTAKDYADECLEQLRQENEYRQREAESKRDNASGTMNQFLRDRLKS